ncbi:medium-chain acyl-CoA ligase ACSF2, mitochondrial-like [Haliotis rufescens]|uniref:medium-chain acyl-CoA ligase ACSF2, mitochondrial-like n=1 Tax=Haliotis rufescens TaxID=6454 RepID=UPI00201E974E|nr:medium-chain acyl-CoA ligase ACSF2, mitochondrial-like [Haliotis rufescens]
MMANRVIGRVPVARLHGRRTEYKKVHQLQVMRCSHTALEKLTFSYAHGASSTPLFGETIGKRLQHQAEINPDNEAIVFSRDNVRRTISQLLDQADQLAAGLLQLGVGRGERVGIWGPNSLEWVLTQYATARAGIILVNINPQYKEQELEYALNKVGCKALIAAPGFKDVDYYQLLFKIIPELATAPPGDIHSHILPQFKMLIMIGDHQYRGALKFSDVMEAGTSKDRAAILDLQRRLQFDDPINIQFTSGTTGFPKGATLSHHNILNNSYMVGQRLGYHQRETRVCMPVPLYHCFGMVLGCLQIPSHGACCVFPSPSFDPEATLQAVEQERCTSLYGVPTMFIDMLNHPNFSRYDYTSLYTGVMAGSPCPAAVMTKVNQLMHMPEVTVCYGLTETSPVTMQSFRHSPQEKRVSTVGQCGAHTEAKVVDEAGEVVPIGTPGELCTRGYTTMLGYWGDVDKTAEVIKPDRWFFTGDIATIDEEGYCRIVGRTKDMIIRGGENIYPTEIEEQLYKHPKVKDVQVIGVPDERLGEEVCACVQLQDGQTTTEAEIKAYCKERLARFKVPRYIQFVTEYPLTVTGKVMKYKIREDAVKSLGLGDLHAD